MKTSEIKKLIAGLKLNGDILAKIEEILGSYGEEVELPDEDLEKIIQLLKLDMDTDKLELKMTEDALVELGGLKGEINQVLNNAEETIEEETKDLYKKVEEGMKGAKNDNL